MKYKAGLYIRLSKEDKNESIRNQQRLLIDYANNMGFVIRDIYIDDGYTGTNFQRPEFQRMLDDIRNNKINMVIVKDMSRLGRDYIKTGELVECFFPINNVRFIAITDNIDTFKDNANNDIAPFKAIINDLYAKDISKKIRTAFKSMQKSGLWTGGCLPLGYKQSPKNKNQIIINDKEKYIVKKIYDLYLQEYSLHQIKEYLNKENIPTFGKIRKNSSNKWSINAIRNILTNQIYTGDLVQNKYRRLSYKYRHIIKNDTNKWVICPDNHPAIISKKAFKMVQNKLKTTIREDKEEIRLLDKLLYCQECSHHLGIRKRNKDGNSYMCCNYYRRHYKKQLCTAHAFNYEVLEQNIIKIVQEIVRKSQFNIDSKLWDNFLEVRNLLLTLIDKIEISQNKEVTIFFKFKDIT